MAKKRTRAKVRRRVSVLLAMRPVRYFKRRGRLAARCHFCHRLIRGGVRGMMKHAEHCAPWTESTRIMADTPGEVQSELASMARELDRCKKKAHRRRG